jgi:hypothetical protein
MANQRIPLYIPTFINSADYKPARVLPRLYFYNGQVDCETWYIADSSNSANTQNSFPYFDHYNVVTGQFPTTDSRSLLFNNEAAAYGEVPTDSLYTSYWEKYISFLYNPKTRLLNCSAIIPLADYFKMELNDVVNFRGNYYHLRAINDYSLKDGTCNLQLLGPIIADTFYEAPIPEPAASSSVSWSYTESSQDGQFKIYDNATTLATLTANGSGNALISQSHYVTASLVPVSYPSSGSVTMSINVNGGTTLAVSSSVNTTISASFLVGSGQTYNITGSIIWNAGPTPPNYVTGAYVIYDFGYASSYPGTGTTVYDVSGNSGPNATFVNSPTWSSTKGGSLSVNSSNYIEYSGKFPTAYTVQAFYKLTSGTSPAYPVIGGQSNNNGVLLAIDTGWPSDSGVYQTYYYGASGNTSAGAANDANAGTNIQNIFTFFSATNNGTNSQEYYVNTGSVSTSTNSHDRTLFTPTNQTVTIGNQGTGVLVAWLVYPFVLSGAEITQNYNIFNAR